MILGIEKKFPFTLEKLSEKLGYQLVRKCIDYISKHYPSYGVRISGQCYAMAFYEKLGFKAEGDTYLEDDIPHIAMILKP